MIFIRKTLRNDKVFIIKIFLDRTRKIFYTLVSIN